MAGVGRSDNKCLICGEELISIYTIEGDNENYSYHCRKCGEYFACSNVFREILIMYYEKHKDYPDFKYNPHHLQCYVYYHQNEARPFLVEKSLFDKLNKKSYSNIYNLTSEMVEAWFPKTFAEQNDYILLYFQEHANYIGEIKSYSYADLANIFMIDQTKYDYKKDSFIDTTLFQQIQYYLSYLISKDWVSSTDDSSNRGIVPDWNTRINIQIRPSALARIDSLQKTMQVSKQVFIAMSFAESLNKANEKIHNAITKNGYEPIRMDKYKHNNQIVPEMLYQIKQSKFIVADLTNHNNGAYYEAGYAAALGKPVILTCKEESFNSDSHFDVKQQATVIWKDEDDLEDKLTSWIEATVGKASEF